MQHINYKAVQVAPSQGRELKHQLELHIGLDGQVAPSQGRELKPELIQTILQSVARRPFTGARVETLVARTARLTLLVAPSQGRELKRKENKKHTVSSRSPLHRGAS